MVPGPELRITEGDVLEVALHNAVPEDTTIHWHGLALRNDMDGVHDLTQSPIRSGESFTYRFTVPDAGTYWFHPHMGLQLDRPCMPRSSWRSETLPATTTSIRSSFSTTGSTASAAPRTTPSTRSAP